MKLCKFTNVINEETEIIIKCDKEFVLGDSNLHNCKIKELGDSVLNDGQVKSATIVDGKLVIELSLDYPTLARYLFEQNAKLIQKTLQGE